MPKIFILFALLPTLLFAGDKIVGGTLPKAKHPASYNTVAFIKAADKKIFCTGSLISRTMILTAKHCLVGKKTEDVLVFFGADTNKPENGIIKKIKRMQVRYPKDWEMTFPSFDVAWVELEEEAPANYKALPILSQKEELPSSDLVHLAGFGNSSLEDGKIAAGTKFVTTTRLKKYYDNSRFFHILLFEGDQGQGACHGDSGGPAYIKTKKGWAIIGVTNGYDIVLTPKAMRRTSDEDFPYHIDCKVNQNLYSFAGAHGAWVEKTSGNKVLKTQSFTLKDKDESASNNSVKSWCERRDFGSPRWNFLKLLLDQKVDSMPQDNAEAFYNNCEEVEAYLESLEEVFISGVKTMDASYSIEPLHLLKLKKLKIIDMNLQNFDLKSSEAIQLEELILNRVELGELQTIIDTKLEIQKLDISSNPIQNIDEIGKLKNLIGVDLGNTPIQDFNALRELSILEELDLSNTSLVSTKTIEGLKLKKLILGDKRLTEVNLNSFKDLEVLSLRNIIFQDLSFLHNTPALTELSLPSLGIENLGVFLTASLPKMRKLNFTGNPIKSLNGLQYLKKLESLRLFGTPLARKQVPKTPENCPLTGSEVLTKFCSH